LHRPARDPALFREPARRKAGRDGRPRLWLPGRPRARDAAFPRLAEPPGLPVDGAGTRPGLRVDHDLQALGGTGVSGLTQPAAPARLLRLPPRAGRPPPPPPRGASHTWAPR